MAARSTEGVNANPWSGRVSATETGMPGEATAVTSTEAACVSATTTAVTPAVLRP